jgi:hypothetical protein
LQNADRLSAHGRTRRPVITSGEIRGGIAVANVHCVENEWTSIPESSAADFLDAIEAPEEPEGVEPFAPGDDMRRELITASVGYSMLLQAATQLRPPACESAHNGGLPHQRYVQRFWPGHGPEPWCAFFVSWCYLEATGRQPPWANKGLVESVRTWASNAGALVGSPAQGDMFGTGGAHMGLVRGVLPAERAVWTIEGNTSSGCVQSLKRPWSGLWFARPR